MSLNRNVTVPLGRSAMTCNYAQSPPRVKHPCPGDRAPARTVIAVHDDGTVLGSANMYANRPGPGSHVASASFMVDPRASGHGVGRALGEDALAWARAGGFRAMQFNAVVETNTRAVALWSSLGFEIIGTVPEAFRHPTDGYVGLHVMYRRL